MINSSPSERMVLGTDAPQTGPYLVLPVARLGDVIRLLDTNYIRHTVPEIYVSIDGEPETTMMHFGPDADAQKIQKLLDSLN